MMCEEVYSRLSQHVRLFFAEHTFDELVWKAGPIGKVLPRFHVIKVSPGPVMNLWTYVSIGAWEVDQDSTSGIEFFLLSDRENDARCTEALAMTAHYHHSEHLGKSHTFPIGEAWGPGSSLDHMLVSLPYMFGPDFEVCSVPGGHIHFFWLLPITAAERQFKSEHGLDALEDEFERQGVEYWNPRRKSVV